MIAVARLDHDGAAECLQGLHRFLRARDDHPVRDRDARAGQQLLGQHLVGGDVHAESGGLLGQRGADQPPVTAVAQAQHAQPADTADRDAAAAGRGGDSRGADAEPFGRHEAGEASEIGIEFGFPFRDNFLDRADGDPQQLRGHRRVRWLILWALHHHVVAAVGASPHGAAQVHIPPGQPGQLERGMLGDVAEVGAPGHRAGEPAGTAGRAVVLGEAGQQRDQPAGESRVAGRLLAGQLVESSRATATGLVVKMFGPLRWRRSISRTSAPLGCWS